MYDILFIGAGPAGYVGAIRAAQLGLKTAIVDKEWLGGVCLNVGCIPSKALLKNAELVRTLRTEAKTFGIAGVEHLTFDYAQAVRRSRQVSQRLTKGVGFLMRKNGIEVHMGTARLVAPNAVLLTPSDGGEPVRLEARNIVIATGAHPLVPPGWDVDGERVLTYRPAILQTRVPASAIIIGGGAIGVEFATIWHSYGAAVTLVEMMPTLLPLEDAEVGKELAKAYKKQGIQVLTGHKVEAIETTDQGVRVTVTDTKKGKAQTLEAEQALVAIGFRPNTAGLGLEEVGVRLTDRGAIAVDERMATNVPGVWAIGDVTAKMMLAHVGSAQGILVAEAVAGRAVHPLDYAAMPRAVYGHPQVAAFGLTEAQAREQGYDITVAKFPFQANGKALALNEGKGFIKLVVDKAYGEILGAHMIGPEVTELLPELTLAHMMEITPTEIARNVHAHPTLSEVLMEVAHVALGEAIHI